ncbi:triadin isoform X15 [Dicentrarchus labrax]|uniref:triadin isoform X15 n=1 Tax=Dicentrarchus labrax TaxID=13489 RepID=UPI0021F554F0|nr:triadin isoform X15 [Dicentrarchus labrax]
MSLQVCHCGWSKVTSYHGLRTHQGKMGCTPRGVKVEESEQQYLWGAQAFSKEFSLDGYISVKTDYSETSLQVCHCGWSKVTTYHGLRTHQGMMGCQLKGIKILKQEQYDRKSQWEEVDQRKLQPVKRTTVKKENAPSALSTNVRTSFVERTATIKEEYKSPQRDPRWSSHRARNSTSTQLNVSVRENPTPTYLEDWTLQTLPKIADSRRIAENSSMDRPVNFATTAATVKEEPKSPLAIQRWSSQRITNSKSGRQAQDLSVGVQVTRSVRECPNIPPPAPVVQPMEKDMRAQTLSHSLVREWPTTTYPATVVRPKERHQKNQTSQNVPVSPSIHSGLAIQRRSSQSNANSKSGRQAHDLSTGVQVNRASRECPTTPTTVVQPKENDTKDPTLSQARQETVKSELQQKIKLQEEKMSEIREWTERACESVQDIVRTNTPINSTAAETTTKEDPKSLCETEQPDFSTGMKVKDLARMFLATTTQDTAVQRKGDRREERKLSQVKHLAQETADTTGQNMTVQPKEKDREVKEISQGKSLVREHPTTTDPATVVRPMERHQKNQTLSQDMTVQPKEKDREVQNISQNVPDSTSATTQFNPASAEATTEEDPKLSCETAQPPDFSTGLKVKELAQMFSTQETAVQPKRKHGEEQKLSQAKVIAKKLSATIAQQKEKDKENQNISQNVLDSTSGTTQMNPATAQATTVQDPTSSCETAQLPDFSTGLKVKDLAQMFSSTTTQETDVQPKRKHRAERRPSQVKLIARKLSAATAQDTAVHPKQRDKWM